MGIGKPELRTELAKNSILGVVTHEPRNSVIPSGKPTEILSIPLTTEIDWENRHSGRERQTPGRFVYLAEVPLETYYKPPLDIQALGLSIRHKSTALNQRATLFIVYSYTHCTITLCILIVL